MVVNIGFEWTRKEDNRQTKINEVLKRRDSTAEKEKDDEIGRKTLN